MCSRLREAQLLGYENYAALVMETKMAKSVDTVLTAYADITLPIKEKCQTELEGLQKFASDRKMKDDLEQWDVAYWKRRQMEEVYK